MVKRRMDTTRMSSDELQTISDFWQRDGGVLEAFGSLVRLFVGRSEYLGQMLGAIRQVADTPAEDSWSGGSVEH